MKKMMLYISLILGMLVFVSNVSATTTAKAPETLPGLDDTLYAILDEEFDFSKISFETSEGGENIKGYNFMRKILLTTNPKADGASIQEKLGDNWFAAYCLDAGAKFPIYGLENFDGFATLSDTQKIQMMVLMYLGNDSKYRSLFEKGKGAILDPSVIYTLPDGQTDATALAQSELVVNVKKIVYMLQADPLNQVEITASDLSGVSGSESFEVKIKKDDINFDKYYSKNMTNNNYNHALWILEHSYPTLDLKSSLGMAGVSYDTLLVEIKTLHDGETKTDEQWSKLIEDYVYSTIQYAIWKANNGIDRDGKTLGSKLIGSAELNKLYTYLILDREEYTNYDKFVFNNEISLVNPKAGKEIYSETNDYFVYGPYSADYDLVSIDQVNVSIENDNKDGISIVDESGNDISKLLPNQKFYIKCLKSAKVTNVKIKLSTLNALTFFPSSNRGRIYSPYYPLTQNVVSGGKIVSTDIEKTVDILFNPKTGVENVAILFVITLVAFSLGYLVLNFNNKKIEFN